MGVPPRVKSNIWSRKSRTKVMGNWLMIQKQRQSIDWLINRETQREPIIFDLRGAKFVSALRRVSIVSFASATYRKTAPENSSKVENSVKTYVFG